MTAGPAPFIRSIPALAAHLRSVHRMHTETSTARMCPAAGLVPAYHPDGLARCSRDGRSLSALQGEAKAMVHIYRRLIDHLHRLPTAFREWQEFDPGAFFDLYPHQARLLVHLDRGTHATRVVFCGDLLMPSFQRAEIYFVDTFTPSYRAAFARQDPDDRARQARHHFRTAVEPEMTRRWQYLTAVAQRVNWALQDDLDFMVVADGSEELFGWRPAWREPGAPGLHTSLCPAWETLTTFTLAVQCKTATASC